MKQKDSEKKLTGARGFDEYYKALYGERWPVLKEALFRENIYVELSWNRESYFMDPGSIVAAMCLPVDGAEKLLDLCAAPGGKTLVLAGIKNKECSLKSNERSAPRKARLDKVVESVLPEEVLPAVVTSHSDGALWCKRESEAYDSILLDAPCSSERHVLADSKYLNDWSPSRIRTLSMEQWSLMSSAWRLLRKEGFLLYGTCALSRDENDGVVAKLLKKFDDGEVCSLEYISGIFARNVSVFSGTMKSELSENVSEYLKKIFSLAVKTEYGFHIRPDCAEGAGPLYFSLIKKINKN
ncbi:16S rRNA C967 or C1407 C5-methylase (RsmB/RsmF family) [Treponema rectale]|uniref:NOL1/NOP2/Sun domain family member 4 n=1 Tax=Treponema rectale TaxID=744512 RepID=A0A840SFU2_9SPIR|nr:RsmB/NOP family class I SAM-dependent RNA methyltransferase [Treponema rectale]MBB5219764.1 16S rRNA C967 or C1407 C5-methylase (RsmB/RsmF family) [Treponema rectale]